MGSLLVRSAVAQRYLHLRSRTNHSQLYSSIIFTASDLRTSSPPAAAARSTASRRLESFLVLGRLLARAKESAPSGGNGRRVISVDRPLRLRTAPRERPGCSPASLPPEGTSWPFSRCIGPDGPPVGGVQQLRLPWFSRKMYVYLRVSGVSLPALLGGKSAVAGKLRHPLHALGHLE